MENKTIHVLLVEDNPGDVDLICDMLDTYGYGGFTIQARPRLDEALARLETNDIDVIITDLWLPDSHGLDTFRRLREAAPGVPVVVLSGNEDEQVALQAVREGAQDYFVKGMFDGGILIRSLRYAMERERSERDKAKLQEQLIQSQKMEIMGKLAGGIAHDFNNMITVILPSAQLGVMETGQDSRLRKLFLSILHAAEQARDLTAKLMTLARKGKANVYPMPVNALLSELAGLLKRTLSKKIQYLIELCDNPCITAMDYNQMLQALLSVCQNAGDAMPEGGTLTITTQTARVDGDPQVSPLEIAPDTWCRILIRDTGAGIPEKIRGKIFEPFITSKSSKMNTGLGLTIARVIIESHGGRIGILNDQDKGTCVEVLLPLVQAPARAAENCGSLSKSQGAETLLIVDDEPLVLSSVADLLAGAGYKTMTADSGKKAMEIFGGQHEEIDLVVLDMLMPNMDGRDVFLAMRKIDSSIPVLVASGYSEYGQISFLRNARKTGFITKPFTLHEIMTSVRQTLCK